MPDKRQPPRTTSIRTQTCKPPRGYVSRPQGRDRVIYKKTAAPVDRKHRSRLACGLEVRGFMTPRMIKLERTNEVCDKSGAGGGPQESRPPIGLEPSAREHDTSDRVGDNRDPDRTARQ